MPDKVTQLKINLISLKVTNDKVKTVQRTLYFSICLWKCEDNISNTISITRTTVWLVIAASG